MLERPAAQKAFPKADRLFLLAVFVLAAFGLIALTSASAPLGYSHFGDSYYFIKKQVLLGLLPGLVLFFAMSHLPYAFWRKWRWPLYLFALFLLALVFVPGLGITINGIRNWIKISSFTFQPSEFAKLALVVVLASLLAEAKNLHDWKTGLLPILAIIAPIVGIVAAQDVGTLSIFGMTIFGMLYVGGVRRAYLIIMGLLAVAAFVGLLLIAPYRTQRLVTFLHPELDPRGIGYQTNQAFLAIGSGQLWGVGLGHSRQKFQYLPEAQADSIFAVIGEEVGFFFSLLLVVLIAFIGLRGLKIAKEAPDPFGRLLVSGVMIWFIWQSFVNIGAMVGVLPLTGVPLPLVSSGGSALALMLAAMGVVASVSRNS